MDFRTNGRSDGNSSSQRITSSRGYSYRSRSAAQRSSVQGENEQEKNTSRKKTSRNEFLKKHTEGKKGGFFRELIMDHGSGDVDYTFLTLVIAVLAMGLVMLLSASAPKGNSMYNDSYFFFKKQIIFAAAGLVGMFIISRIDYHLYRKYAALAYWIGVGLLILVLIPGIGVRINGARRWLFGVIQPSELVKPIIAMFVAHLITSKKLEMKKFGDVFFLMLVVGLVAAFMIFEPHVSGALIIISIAAVIMIAAGIPILPLVGVGSILLVVVGFGCYIGSPTRWARVTSFLNPFGSGQQSNSYQIVQSIYSIGSGGITGLGLGQSVQKFQYLPEPYNDFIFAIVCEELGLLGALVVIGLFLALVIRGVKIAMNAPDKYSMLFAVGIVAQIAIQALLNIAVAISAVPNTGVSLPFFSYGGTSIFTLLCEMGVLLNISRQSKTNYRVLIRRKGKEE